MPCSNCLVSGTTIEPTTQMYLLPRTIGHPSSHRCSAAPVTRPFLTPPNTRSTSKQSMQVTLVRLRVEGLESFVQALMIASVLPWLPRGGHTYPSGAVVYVAAVPKPPSIEQCKLQPALRSQPAPGKGVGFHGRWVQVGVLALALSSCMTLAGDISFPSLFSSLQNGSY